MQVKEIMTSRTELAGPELSIQDAARRMRDLDIGSLPVWEDGQLIGIVTDRDICCRAIAGGLDASKTPVREIMTREVAFCFGDDDIANAAHLMEGKHLRRLAVLNDDRTMAGFLSVDDLALVSHQLAGEVLEAVRPTH